MAAPAKTVGTNLLTLQTLATALVAVGPTVDVSTKFAGTAYVHFGRTVTSALTNAVRFRIEASASATIHGQWYPMYEWISDITACALVPTATAGASGGNSITFTNTGSAIAAGDKLFIKNGTLASSEWGRVATLVSTTSITLEDNLVNAQTTSVLSPKAEFFAIPLDFSGVGRVRLVVSTAQPAAGQTVAAEGWLTTLDTIA
jgi:hypothetical protein